MRTKKHKLFWLWSFDKEERWLNEMSRQGKQLVSVGFCTYYFEDGTPGEYIYRLQMLDSVGLKSQSSYISLLKETGAEHVGSLFRWIYVRKKASDGPFELFSDIDTRVRHMNGMLVLAALVGALNLLNGANMFHRFFSDSSQIGLVIPILCTCVGLLGTFGFARIWVMRRRLLKDRILHE